MRIIIQAGLLAAYAAACATAEQVPVYVWGKTESVIPEALKQQQFSNSLHVDSVLQHLSQGLHNAKEKIVVFEHEHMPIQDMMHLKTHYNDLNTALNKAKSTFYSTAFPLTEEYTNNMITVNSPSEVDSVDCSKNNNKGPCVVLVRAEKMTNDVFTSVLDSFEKKFGDSYVGVWTSKAVAQTNAAVKSLRQHATNEKYGLNRKARSATIGSSANTNYGNGDITVGGPPGYEKDYRFLTPAIVMTLFIMSIIVGTIITGTTLMASIQAPVHFQDPKIPIVGKEGN